MTRRRQILMPRIATGYYGITGPELYVNRSLGQLNGTRQRSRYRIFIVNLNLWIHRSKFPF